MKHNYVTILALDFKLSLLYFNHRRPRVPRPPQLAPDKPIIISPDSSDEEDHEAAPELPLVADVVDLAESYEELPDINLS